MELMTRAGIVPGAPLSEAACASSRLPGNVTDVLCKGPDGKDRAAES